MADNDPKLNSGFMDRVRGSIANTRSSIYARMPMFVTQPPSVGKGPLIAGIIGSMVLLGTIIALIVFLVGPGPESIQQIAAQRIADKEQLQHEETMRSVKVYGGAALALAGLVFTPLPCIFFGFPCWSVYESTLNRYPNLDRLGSGYNMFGGNPRMCEAGKFDPGFKSGIFEITYHQGRTQRDSRAKALPDHVEITEHDAQHGTKLVQVVSGAASYANALSADISASGSFFGAKFSAEANYQNEVKSSQESHTMYVFQSDMITKYSAKLSRSAMKFKADFIRSVKDTFHGVVRNTEDAARRIHSMLSMWGTHVVTGVEYGARKGLRRQVSKSIVEKEEMTTMGAKASVTHLVAEASAGVQNTNEQRNSDENLFESTSYFSIGLKDEEDPKVWLEQPMNTPAPITFEMFSLIDLIIERKSEFGLNSAQVKVAEEAQKKMCEFIKANADPNMQWIVDPCDEFIKDAIGGPKRKCPRSNFWRTWNGLIDAIDKKDEIGTQSCENDNKQGFLPLTGLKFERTALDKSTSAYQRRNDKFDEANFQRVALACSTSLSDQSDDQGWMAWKGNHDLKQYDGHGNKRLLEISCASGHHATGFRVSYHKQPGWESRKSYGMTASLRCASTNAFVMDACVYTNWETLGTMGNPKEAVHECPRNHIINAMQFLHWGDDGGLYEMHARAYCCQALKECIN